MQNKLSLKYTAQFIKRKLQEGRPEKQVYRMGSGMPSTAAPTTWGGGGGGQPYRRDPIGTTYVIVKSQTVKLSE